MLDLRTAEQLWQAEFEVRILPTALPELSPHRLVYEGLVVVQPTDLSEPLVRTLAGAREVHWSPSASTTASSS